ncbi:Serine/threonine-protein kinase Nek8, partial [Pseudolycoriella hygida]
MSGVSNKIKLSTLSNKNGTNGFLNETVTVNSSLITTKTRTQTSINEIDEQKNSEDDEEVELPEYEKIKVVGRGSFGVAILYLKKSNQSNVVLKQINLNHLTKMEKDLALNEVEVFSKLHHPNIICYIGSFVRGNVLLIEMEYANGGTLAQILSQKEPHDFMSERYILTIFEQITSAINYMHSENIMHRDLKTANVFLNLKGTVKIGDFGISKIMNTKIHAQTVLGTPYYFSPEMCEGKDYDNKSDIWALGCILGEMCCLQKAFAATNLSELVAKIMS